MTQNKFYFDFRPEPEVRRREVLEERNVDKENRTSGSGRENRTSAFRLPPTTATLSKKGQDSAELVEMVSIFYFVARQPSLRLVTMLTQN